MTAPPRYGAVNPLATGANANTTTGVGHGDNIKPGYAVINFGIQTGAGAEQGHNQGTQTFADVRWGYGSWFSPRFRQWAVPPDLNDVDIIKRVNRGEYGYVITEPFDQHFLMAMIAPRALLLQDGYLSNNTNPEGTYLGHLAAREVYRFLGVPEKIGLNMHLINHANPLREQMELGEFMTAVFDGQPLHPKFHVEPFPINDPRSLYDYEKLDWAAPGYKSLQKQVRELSLTETDRPSASVRADRTSRRSGQELVPVSPPGLVTAGHPCATARGCPFLAPGSAPRLGDDRGREGGRADERGGAAQARVLAERHDPDLRLARLPDERLLAQGLADGGLDRGPRPA